MSKEGRRLALSSKSIAKSASRLMAGWGATNSYRPHKNLCKKVRTVALLTRINLDSTKHTVREVELLVEGMSKHLRGEWGILYSQYISKGGLVKGSNCLENDIRWGPNLMLMLLMLHFVQTVPVRIDQHYILQNWLGIPFSF